jgi:hypothetical protein
MAHTTPDRAFQKLDTMGNENERASIEHARELIRDYVVVYDEPTNMAGLQRRFRRHQVEFGNELVLHVVDHLGAFAGINRGKMWEQFAVLGRQFKQDLAASYGASVLLLAHSSRQVEQEFKQNNRVNVSTLDAYGGSAIRQWSDVFMAVGRHNGQDEYGHPDSRFFTATIVQTCKNRQGLGFSNDLVVFDYDPEHEYLTNTVLVDSQKDMPYSDDRGPELDPIEF